jgi:hypothetical protein
LPLQFRESSLLPCEFLVLGSQERCRGARHAEPPFA